MGAIADLQVHEGERYDILGWLLKELNGIIAYGVEAIRHVCVPHQRVRRRWIPGSRLEALRSGRKCQWSIRINDRWRVCFEWPKGSNGPTYVVIVDYH